ncbi:hypothetical protein BGZ97_008889 [Linnemannia gamsii]|uniref:DASH complex subunit DUO1 n=1 Tax=Linnemannia gamsii TaxID=64522 RepID=A0A9P6UQ90_9FUNG|nr:hypothetical protein BGZ97_008889 [Linnemannia gamsii]
MNYLRHQSSSHVASAAATSNITNSSNLSSSSSEHANAPSTTTTGPPLGMRTPSRVKRARYNVDPPEMYASEHQEQQRRQQEAQIQQQQQQRVTMSTSAGAGGSGGAVSSSYSQGSILTELEETRRLVRAFDTIDTSMTEARDKLKTFYKTADETNTLLDMWIRVLSQTEHTQKLLQDPAWEGQTMEEARDKEHQERRAAYHLAMEEATRPQNTFNNNTLQANPTSFASSTSNNPSTNSRHLSSSINNPTFNLNRSQTQASSNNLSNNNNPLKKSSSALAAAAHAHASVIAANRKRNLAAAAGSGSGGGGGRP